MKVFLPKDKKFKDIVQNVDDNIIQRLVQRCFRIKKEDEYSKVYSEFYNSKYPLKDLSTLEQSLEEYIKEIVSKPSSAVKTKVQGKEYRWVIIDEDHIGETAFRYYFAPNPSNMHEIVKRLIAQLSSKKIPAEFKYQLKDKMSECDRIILYSDFAHQKDIEQAIKSVYNQQPSLFDGSERPLPWLYKSKIPNVYLAPETPGSSYGEEFARTMIESKRIFCFLYGITDTNNSIQLKGEEARKAIEYMELIIGSSMLRNGLLLTKNNKRIVFNDKIESLYNYKTGELTRYCTDNYGFHSVVYLQNTDGKNALLNSFYTVSQMQPQNGIKVEHLTPKERRKKLYETFGWYADEFKNTPSKPYSDNR